MSDNIVISFSNKDRAFVEALSEQLNQRLSRYRTVRGDEAGDGRPRVWTYPQQTDGSRQIIEIHRQLDQALAVIVVLSEHSAASRWVLEEVQVVWNADKLIIPIAIGERSAIKQSDVGKLLGTRTWIYAEELDTATVADSIVNTLLELGKISKAEIGSRYRHKRQLTTRPTGGYFEATRDDDERLFVVKEVSSSDREVLRELDAKIARLQQLRNPALPLIEDYLQEEGRRYIVWEEVPGRHLGDVLAAQKDQPLAWADIQPWVADALTTLALLHQAKVLHLGLKPQNFKRTRDGQIKLLDLGLDRRAAGTAATGTTDPFLAPELLDERDPSPRSDLYAAGAVLYTLLTGDRQPSPAKPPVAKRNREVPEHVSQTIAKAMSPEPAQRFRSANEFLVALEGTQAPIGTQPKRPAWLIPAGAAALVGLLALVLLLPRLLSSSEPGVDESTAAAPTSAPVAAATVATGAQPNPVSVAAESAVPTVSSLPASFETVMKLVSSNTIDPQRGQMLWEQREAATISLNQNNNTYGVKPLPITASDFVLYAEVDWGEHLAQCEISFRNSDSGNYVAGIKRDGTVFAGQGQPSWKPLAIIQPVAALRTREDERNTIVYIVRGSRILLYVNGALAIDVIDSSHKQGSISLAAHDNDENEVNTSPLPSCTFSNTWVWAPDAPAAAAIAPTPTARPLPASFDAVMGMLGLNNVTGKLATSINSSVSIPLDKSGDYPGLSGWRGLQVSASNFVLHAEVQSGDLDDECSVYFHQNQSGEDGYAVGIRPSGTVFSQKKTNGRQGNWKESTVSSLTTGASARNSVVLTAFGGNYSLYVNGRQEPVHSFTDADYVEGTITLAAWSPNGINANGQSSCTFSDVWVWAPDAPAANAGQRPPPDTLISPEDQASAETILQRVATATLLFNESFDGPGSRFWIGEYERGGSVIENGQFKIEALTEYPLQAHAVSEAGRRELRGDFSIASDVSIQSGLANAGGGIVFGGAGNDEASWQTSEVLVYGDGTWAVRTYRNQAFDQQFSLERTQHSAILRDGRANRLQVDRSGETVVITINGTVVGIITGSPVVEGWFGLTVVRADGNPIATAWFDNVEVREVR